MEPGGNLVKDLEELMRNSEKMRKEAVAMIAENVRIKKKLRADLERISKYL